MRNIAIIERLPSAGGMQRELVGPKTGVDSCRILQVSLPPNAESGSANEDEERLIYLRSGLIDVTSGREVVRLKGGDYIFLPRARSHCLRNVGGSAADVFDVRATMAKRDDGPSASVDARPISTFVGELDGEGFSSHEGHRAHGRTFDTKVLIDREKGSARMKAFAALVPPGSGMDLHIHSFDQFYLVLEGTIDIQMGLAKTTVQGQAAIVFPAGIVHANRNSTADVIKQITINIQERSSETLEVSLSSMKR